MVPTICFGQRPLASSVGATLVPLPQEGSNAVCFLRYCLGLANEQSMAQQSCTPPPAQPEF
eukprot:288481-Lingulodinium_polyedra.AAC.1